MAVSGYSTFSVRLRKRDILNFIRYLIGAGAKEDWVSIKSLDFHISKITFMLAFLAKHKIVALRTATRAYTRSERGYIMLPPDFVSYSHVKLMPDIAKKVDELLFS